MLPREKVAIRSMSAADAPLLFALAGESFGETLPGEETVAVLTRCQVFVAVAGDDLAGYVALIDEGAELCIRQLLVAPAHADGGRRVADQLLDWAEGYAFNHAFERLRVDIGDDEVSARRFYSRRGYLAGRDGSIGLDLPAAV